MLCSRFRAGWILLQAQTYTAARAEIQAYRLKLQTSHQAIKDIVLTELHVYIILNLLCTNKLKVVDVPIFQLFLVQNQFWVGQNTQHVVDNLTHSSILLAISFIVDLKLGYSFVNHIDTDRNIVAVKRSFEPLLREQLQN